MAQSIKNIKLITLTFSESFLQYNFQEKLFATMIMGSKQIISDVYVTGQHHPSNDSR